MNTKICLSISNHHPARDACGELRARRDWVLSRTLRRPTGALAAQLVHPHRAGAAHAAERAVAVRIPCPTGRGGRPLSPQVALIAFLPTKADGALGALEYGPEERRALALAARLQLAFATHALGAEAAEGRVCC